MDFGFHFFDFTIPGSPDSTAATLRAGAHAGEQVGASWLTVMDHWFQMEAVQPAERPMLEAYTTLGFLAGVTERAKLGTIVTGVTYRYPALLAKIATTLDVLSGGRAFLGLGAAWYEREHAALGVPFPPIAERFELLEETLRIVLQMWSKDDGPFESAHFRLAETICSPPPVQHPHPPIVIGGSGERKTLRLVAQYADACNLIVADPAEAAHKLGVLAEHCARLGRDPAEIEKTVISRAVYQRMPADELLRLAEGFAAVGVTRMHFSVPGSELVPTIERFGRDCAPALAAL